ncbi:Hypothetical protein PSEBR_m1626 [Pseudomonas brassicacearum subsp. brassicacearum NFM421]|uniref:Uncharacterized protein n=1 Tax=Pseudomonas brassicacearum (strain NFM421) TaxID=994484 RepID=F2KMA2_PSEBN|nr:Hypothetical protein PSEBR_m1626 [Pseudomonas brassicacearum subsp. brassicacearum NFM421]
MSHCHRCNGRGGGFLRVELDEYCFRITIDPCVSELARDSGVSAMTVRTEQTPSRASSLPQGPAVDTDLRRT